MEPTVFPTQPSHADSPGRILASATGLARRTLLLGYTALAATAAAPAAITDLSGNLTVALDTAVGAGNSGRLVANTQTHWGGMTSSSPVALNGNQFTIDNGGGNAQSYNGAIAGPGSLRIQGRYPADWDPDIQLGGSAANSPTSVDLANGRLTLNKTSGVDALAGTITVLSSSNPRFIWLKKSNQISDTATINATLGTGVFTLKMNGFSERIGTLSIKTGNKVDTGVGGVLNVEHLIVDGVEQNKGAFTVNSGYVLGTGYIDVQDFGPPVINNPPGVPASPTPTVAANTVHPAYLTKLTWATALDATSYDVYLWLASDTKPATPAANVALPEYPVSPQVFSLSNYKWQVVAKNTIGNTAGPEWTFSTIDRRDISGNLTQALDAIVGAGPARLTANAMTIYSGGNFAAGVNLNSFQFTIDNGGGNPQNYLGAITGPGTLRISGRFDASWAEDIMLGGTLANSPDGVTLASGRCRLNKTAGVDALAGAVTVNTGGAVRLQLLKSNQINDASTITSTASSGAFYLELGGFSDTISGLNIKTGHLVSTGTGGVLTVSSLIVNGETLTGGPYTSGNSTFVTGGGSVVVAAGGSAFATWATSKGLTGGAADFEADPDGDGIKNGLEFILGGEPNPANAGANSAGLLPTGEVVGTGFVFAFTLMNAAAYLNPVVEFDADLRGVWTTATDPGNATILVTPGSPSATVKVTIPKGANTEMFARLKAVKP